MATGGWDGDVTLHNAMTGKQEKALSRNYKGIFAFAFSPDGKYLVGGMDKGAMQNPRGDISICGMS